MNADQIREILTPEFSKELANLETPEEVKEALGKKGIDISIDEIIKVQQMMEARFSNQGELSEDDLADVAGGGLFQTLTGFFTEGIDQISTWTRRRW